MDHLFRKYFASISISTLATVLILFIGHQPANSANILFGQDIPWSSHFVWNFAIVEGLLERGHNVTMLSTDANAKGKDKEHYYPVVLEGVHKKIHKKHKTFHLKTLSPLNYLQKNLQYTYDVCNLTYHSEGFQRLWKSDNLTFHLIIMDVTLGQCMYPLIEKFGSPPTIAVSANTFSPSIATAFGNEIYPAYVPHTQLSNYTENMDFFQRVWNYIFTNLDVYIHHNYKLGKLQNLAVQVLNKRFDFKSLEKRISLFLANYNPLMDTPQSLAPNVIPIGGMHVNMNETMDNMLTTILDNAETGFIFFSFGANINVTTSISLAKRKTFAKAFEKLHRRTVVWKYDGIDEFGFDVPENVMTHTWLPQNGVLSHPNAALLITNGGLLSLQEAAFHGVPVVVIPFTAEQQRNAQRVVDRKIGIKLEFADLNEDNLYEAMMEVLEEDEEYVNNARALAKRLSGQPQYLLQKAVIWAEFAIHQNGTNFLVPKSRYLSYFIGSSKDVELFLLSAIIIVMLFSLVIFLLLWKCLRSSKSKKEMHVIKKKKLN